MQSSQGPTYKGQPLYYWDSEKAAMVPIEPGDDLSQLSHGSPSDVLLDDHLAALFCMMLVCMHQRTVPYSGCWKSWNSPDGLFDPNYFWAGSLLSSGPIYYRLAGDWWDRCHVPEKAIAPLGGSLAKPEDILDREIKWLRHG